MSEIGRFITLDPIMGVRTLDLKDSVSLDLSSHVEDNPLRFLNPRVSMFSKAMENCSRLVKKSSTIHFCHLLQDKLGIVKQSTITTLLCEWTKIVCKYSVTINTL